MRMSRLGLVAAIAGRYGAAPAFRWPLQIGVGDHDAALRRGRTPRAASATGTCRTAWSRRSSTTSASGRPVGVVRRAPSRRSSPRSTRPAARSSTSAWSGENNDQLAQMFTVGGLSTVELHPLRHVSRAVVRHDPGVRQAPLPARLRRSRPSASTSSPTTPSPAAIRSSPSRRPPTNNCGVDGHRLRRLPRRLHLDDPRAHSRSAAARGRPAATGFNHPVLDLATPRARSSCRRSWARPGKSGPTDGVMDPAHGTTCGRGLLRAHRRGASSSMPTARGARRRPSRAAEQPLRCHQHAHHRARQPRRSGAALPAGVRSPTRAGSTSAPGTTCAAARQRRSWRWLARPRRLLDRHHLRRRRRRRHGATSRRSIVVTRVGRCTLNTTVTCKSNADCTGIGTCADPASLVRDPGFSPGGADHPHPHRRRRAPSAASSCRVGDYELMVSSYERDDVIASPVMVTASDRHPGDHPADDRPRHRELHRPREEGGHAASPGEAHLQGRGPDARSPLPPRRDRAPRHHRPDARDLRRHPGGDGGARRGAGERRLHGDRAGRHPGSAGDVRRLRVARHGVQRPAQADRGHRRREHPSRLHAEALGEDQGRDVGRLPRPLRTEPRRLGAAPRSRGGVRGRRRWLFQG